MDSPKLIVSICMGKPIRIQLVSSYRDTVRWKEMAALSHLIVSLICPRLKSTLCNDVVVYRQCPTLYTVFFMRLQQWIIFFVLISLSNYIKVTAGSLHNKLCHFPFHHNYYTNLYNYVLSIDPNFLQKVILVTTIGDSSFSKNIW